MLTFLFVLGLVWCAYWLVKLWLDWGHTTPASRAKKLCATCRDSLMSQTKKSAQSVAMRNVDKPTGNTAAVASAKPASSFTVATTRATTATTAAAAATIPVTTTSIAAPNDTSKSAQLKVNADQQTASDIKNSETKVTPLFKAPAEKDDLKVIKGIGVVMEKTLNDLGVTTYKQLADFQQTEVKMVADVLSKSNSGFGDRIERDEWVDQAKGLVRKAG